jgi:hypothetical protein
MKSYNFFLFLFFLTLMVTSCTKENSDPKNPVDTKYTLKIKGIAKSCNGSAITNGVVAIVTNLNAFTLPLTNGMFDTSLIATSPFDSVFLWTIDYNNLTSSDTLKRKISTDSIYFGNIATCTPLKEYLNLRINNEAFIYVPIVWDTLNTVAWDTINAPTTYFYRQNASQLNNNKFYRMQFNGIASGTFGMHWNSAFHMGRYYTFNLPASGRITYTIYPNVGSYITGNLNVPFIDNTDSLQYTLTGNFKVKRNR